MQRQQLSGQIKSRQRVAAHGEVYTSAREVRAMCDLAAAEAERPGSRVLEPACGNGNFLSEILSRRLEAAALRCSRMPGDYQLQAVEALSGLYGIDILEDNVAECRERLFRIWEAAYARSCGKAAGAECLAALRFILKKNILCADALAMQLPDGSPLVFPEWTFLEGGLVRRRDFRFEVQPPGGTAGHGGSVLKPVLVQELEPVSWLKLQEAG